MHGVAPHMCGQVGHPLSDRGAGGRSPGFRPKGRLDMPSGPFLGRSQPLAPRRIFWNWKVRSEFAVKSGQRYYAAAVWARMCRAINESFAAPREAEPTETRQGKRR
jgi:hypothetical protein